MVILKIYKKKVKNDKMQYEMGVKMIIMSNYYSPF